MTRVLLLLILQPSPQRLAPSLAQVLEKYAWIEENVNNGKMTNDAEFVYFLFFVKVPIFDKKT